MLDMSTKAYLMMLGARSVDGSGGDAAVVYSQEAPGLLDGLRESLHHGIYAVVEYFD